MAHNLKLEIGRYKRRVSIDHDKSPTHSTVVLSPKVEKQHQWSEKSHHNSDTATKGSDQSDLATKGSDQSDSTTKGRDERDSATKGRDERDLVTKGRDEQDSAKGSQDERDSGYVDAFSWKPPGNIEAIPLTVDPSDKIALPSEEEPPPQLHPRFTTTTTTAAGGQDRGPQPTSPVGLKPGVSKETGSIRTWSDVPDDISGLSVRDVNHCMRLLKVNHLFKEVDGVLLQDLSMEDLTTYYKIAPTEAKKIVRFVNGWRLKL